jgi:hypothetical protein
MWIRDRPVQEAKWPSHIETLCLSACPGTVLRLLALESHPPLHRGERHGARGVDRFRPLAGTVSDFSVYAGEHAAPASRTTRRKGIPPGRRLLPVADRSPFTGDPFHDSLTLALEPLHSPLPCRPHRCTESSSARSLRSTRQDRGRCPHLVPARWRGVSLRDRYGSRSDLHRAGRRARERAAHHAPRTPPALPFESTGRFTGSLTRSWTAG